MAYASEQVAQAAQESVKEGGQTVGNALQAYHMAATTENARQELEMQKQNQELNKAKWMSDQVDKVSRMEPGKTQNILLDSLKKHAVQIYPGTNPDNFDVLKDKPELIPVLQDTLTRYANGQDLKGSDFPNLATIMQSHSADFNSMLEKSRQEKMNMLGNQLKANAMGGRVEVQQDNSTAAAFDKFTKDTQLPKLEGLGHKLDRDTLTLKQEDSKHPVSYQTVHEILMNVASVLADGQLSDTRVASITPHLGDEVLTQLKTYASNDPNQPADPKLLDYTSHLINRLNAAVGQDVTSRAANIGSARGPEFFHNPAIAKANSQMVDYYGTNKWRANYARQGAVAPPSPEQAATPPPPVNYGRSLEDIDKNWKIFQAEEAHKKATAGEQ